MEFSEAAPTINEAGVTKTDIDKITVKETSGASEAPALDKAKTLAILADFADIEKANGYLSIAQKNGVTMEQVKTLHKEFLAVKSLDVPKEVEEI